MTPGSWLYENRPQWLLKLPKVDDCLLNLGLPEARQWAAATIDRLMTEEGIDLYRQDFNIHPLPFWLAADGPDRQGLTENHYVQGHLWFLDELRRRRPGLVIDLCASGGMRHDLESLRRGIVFTQSDYDVTPEGDLNQNYTLPFLMPYHGHSVPYTDAYGFWCHATPGLHPRWDIRKRDQMDKHIARRVQVWREQVAPCYWGDYYPLTPYSSSPDTWTVWQYNHPSEKRSVVQAFRRATAPEERGRFRLRGLDRQADYEVTVLDGAGLGEQPRTIRGAELIDAGIEIVIPSRAGVSIVSVKAVGPSAADLVEPSAKVELVAGEFQFTEGPVCDKQGNLYFSDIRASRIYLWSADHKLSVFREPSGRANGLRFDRAGNLLACEGAARRVTATAPDGTVTVLADRYQGKRLNSPNDLWVDAKGGIYFTDPRYTGARWVWSDKSAPANGGDDPDDRETYAFDVQADGSLTGRRVVVPDYSDGMTLDERGNLYLTNGGVDVYTPDGRLITTIELPAKSANVAFGGKDGRTLFITAREGLYALRMKVRGQ